MSEVETFVKIEGFEKYEVSNLGKVRNIKSGRMLKPHLNHNGYLKHHLYRHDKKPQVNHIDENKLNNDLSNLEWCTGRENLVHGTRTKRVAEKLSKKVIQLDLNDSVLNEFESMGQAERETGVPSGNISRCCNGERKSAGGYKWRKK